MRKLLIRSVCLVITVLICTLMVRTDVKQKTKGIDLISTITTNNQEKLLVVANQNVISNKQEFAKEIMEKYLSNSFDSIKLSSDIRGDIETVIAVIYLNKEDIERCHPEMEIEYRFEQKDSRNVREIELCIDGTIHKIELKK